MMQHTQSQHPPSTDAASPMDDIAYTINHAIACTATDFIDPFVGNATQKWLGKRFSVGCGHDHGHFHDPSCPHDGHASHSLGHWWLGELAGDFGSVPVTIAIQRHAPGLMKALEKGMEKIASPLFRASAERAARRQARTFGATSSEAEIQQRAEEIYRHEIRHMPLAAIWTASSVALNVGVQKLTGNTAPLWQIGVSKLAGVSFSTGLTLGLRAAAPGAMQKLDATASEKLYLPVAKKVGAIFGVEEQAIEHAAKQERHHNSWAERETQRQQHPASAMVIK